MLSKTTYNMNDTLQITAITAIPEHSILELTKFAKYLIEEVLVDMPDSAKIIVMNIAYDRLRHNTFQEIQRIETELKQRKENLEAFTFSPKRI